MERDIDLEFNPRLNLAVSVYGKCQEEVSIQSNLTEITLISLIIPSVTPKHMSTWAEISIGRYSKWPVLWLKPYTSKSRLNVSLHHLRCSVV